MITTGRNIDEDSDGVSVVSVMGIIMVFMIVIDGNGKDTVSV